MERKSKLEEYTKAELIDKLTRLYDRPFIAETIYSLIAKIDQINELFNATDIDITSDVDKTFVNFVNFSDKVVKIISNIDALMEMIDPDIRAEIKERQRSGSGVDLENMIKNVKRKNVK